MSRKKRADNRSLTDRQIKRFAELWANPDNTLEQIALQFGRSKNAMAGYRMRLGLPERGSPIRRRTDPGFVSRDKKRTKLDPPAKPNKKKVAAPVTAQIPTPPPAAPPLPVPPFVPARPEPVTDDPVPPPMPYPPPRPIRMAECCWPIGEPGTKAFRFCEATIARGQTYCAAHAGRAYVRVRDRRDDHAEGGA